MLKNISHIFCMVFSLMFLKYSNVKKKLSTQISYELPLGASSFFNDKEHVPTHITHFLYTSISLEEAWGVPVYPFVPYKPYRVVEAISRM